MYWQHPENYHYCKQHLIDLGLDNNNLSDNTLLEPLNPLITNHNEDPNNFEFYIDDENQDLHQPQTPQQHQQQQPTPFTTTTSSSIFPPGPHYGRGPHRQEPHYGSYATRHQQKQQRENSNQSNENVDNAKKRRQTENLSPNITQNSTTTITSPFTLNDNNKTKHTTTTTSNNPTSEAHSNMHKTKKVTFGTEQISTYQLGDLPKYYTEGTAQQIPKEKVILLLDGLLANKTYNTYTSPLQTTLAMLSNKLNIQPTNDLDNITHELHPNTLLALQDTAKNTLTTNNEPKQLHIFYDGSYTPPQNEDTEQPSAAKAGAAFVILQQHNDQVYSFIGVASIPCTTDTTSPHYTHIDELNPYNSENTACIHALLCLNQQTTTQHYSSHLTWRLQTLQWHSNIHKSLQCL